MTIQAQMIQLKRDWVELWYKMANGLKSEFDRIKATDIFDFWGIYDLWLDRIKSENSKRTSQNK